MKTVQLGKSGLVVSEVGFGGIPIIPIGRENAVKVIKYCYERGITFYDTANMYGDSEKMLGEALEAVRDKVVIATKTTNRDKAGAAEHIALSLENLRSDYIDLYQFHNVSKDEELAQVLGADGAMEAVQEAIQAGRIKQVGVTSHKIETAIKACQTGLFATLQFPFNFVEQDPLDELFDVARAQNMGIIAMKPLGGGLLDKASLCFKFLQQHLDVVPIPGISKPEEIDEILDLYQAPQSLSAEELTEIETIRVELGQKFCHRCGYCQPCDEGVAITEIFTFRSTAKRFDPKFAAMLAQKAMQTAENCTECGQCIEKCPYDLEIPELIREVQTLYKQLSA